MIQKHKRNSNYYRRTDENSVRFFGEPDADKKETKNR